MSEYLICMQWPSTKLEITCPPHLPDPYEEQLVEICKSSVSGGGEGLGAKVDIPGNTLVSFYRGVRMKPADENIFEKATGYAIYLEWEIEARDNSDILDIAPQVRNIDITCSTRISHISSTIHPPTTPPPLHTR